VLILDKLENDEISLTKSRESQELERKFKWTSDRIIFALMFSFIVIVTIILFILLLIDNTLLFRLITNYFLKPINQLHVTLKILIFFGFMILQSIIAPIPSELILTTGGILFHWWGIPIGVAGSMLSATISYYISKRGGRSIIDASGDKLKIIDRTVIIFDKWIERWGLWAIILSRAVPFIAFDNVSYAAGIAKIEDSHYLIATLIGSIPRTAFYCFMGIKLLGENSIEDLINNPTLIESTASQFNLIFYILFGIMIFAFVVTNTAAYCFERRKHRNGEDSTEEMKKQENEEKIVSKTQVE